MISDMQPHLGRISTLQSRLDSIPKTIESAVEKRLRESNQQQILSQLAPEQRKAYEEQLRDREAQTAELRKIILETIREAAPNGGLSAEQMRAINNIQNQQDAQGFFSSIEDALGAENLKRIAPVIDEFLKQHQQDLRNPDPAVRDEAKKRMNDALARPERFALNALRKVQEQTQEGADQVVQQRQQQQAKLSLVPRGSAAKGVKNIKGMSQKQLESDPDILNMSATDYEKLLANQAA